MNNTFTRKVSLLICLTFLLSLSIVAQTQPKYRTFDGSQNNVSYPNFGKTGIPFFRELPAEYADGRNAIVTNRPNPRLLSNRLSNEPEDKHNDRYMAGMFYSFGQFFDHDITRRAGGSEAAAIPLPSGESRFTAPIGFTRSATHPGSGVTTPRDQTNTTTAWVDASHIYGDDIARANWLRTFQGGRLKVSAGNLLPFNTVTGEFDAAIDPAAPVMDDTRNRATGAVQKVFIAGDPRASEHPVLTSLHTLFVREHNRICSTLSTSGLSDEEIYQRARKEVGALMQSIVFGQWISSLGVNLNAYSGYKPAARPDIMNTFATAAYRWHTMVENDIIFRNNSCNGVGPVQLPLKDIFFNNSIVRQYGIDVLLKGISVHRSYETDLQVANGLRNNLFGPGQNSDLVAINIQRGRDHGLPNYNTVRQFYTGSPAYTFTDIAGSSRTSVASSIPSSSSSSLGLLISSEMQALYGSVSNVDLWVGLYAEPRLAGKSVGRTVDAILRAQLERLRDGDYYYFENDPAFTAADKSRIRSTTLKQIIERNTTAGDLQENVFFVKSCASDPSRFDDIAKRSCSETPQYDGWTFIGKQGTKSYYRWNAGPVNFEDAKDLAARLGGTLPRVMNATENNYLKGIIGSAAWLDLNRVGTQWHFTNEFDANDNLVVTGIAGYFSWRVGEPNNVGGTENRVQLHPDGVWNDIPETALQTVISEVECQEDCSPFANSVVTEYNVNNAAWMTSNTVTVQAGQHLVLSANPNGAASYRWTGPNGFNFTTTSWGGDALISGAVTTAHAGTYTVEVRSASGCVGTKSINVIVNDLCSPFTNSVVTEYNINNAAWVTSNTVTVNAGQHLQLSANPNGAASYNWTGPNGFVRLGSPNGDVLLASAANASHAGTYTVQVRSANGCIGTKSINVVVNSNPCANDFTPPTFTYCPPHMSVSYGTLSTGKNVSWAEPTATDNCSGVTVRQIAGQANGSFFSGGLLGSSTYTIMYEAVDTKGNKAYCTFTVIVYRNIFQLFLQGNESVTLEAKAEPNRTHLEWVSNLNTNQSDYFEVQKLNVTTNQYENLEIVNNVSKDNSLSHYTAYDNNPTEGDNFYKVVAVLNDGTKKETEVKKVTFGEYTVANIYPNPVESELNIDLKNYKGSPVTVYVYNSFGKLLQTKQVESAASTLQLNVSDMNSGNYLIRIASKGKKDFTKQVVITH